MVVDQVTSRGDQGDKVKGLVLAPGAFGVGSPVLGGPGRRLVRSADAQGIKGANNNDQGNGYDNEGIHELISSVWRHGLTGHPAPMVTPEPGFGNRQWPHPQKRKTGKHLPSPI